MDISISLILLVSFFVMEPSSSTLSLSADNLSFHALVAKALAHQSNMSGRQACPTPVSTQSDSPNSVSSGANGCADTTSAPLSVPCLKKTLLRLPSDSRPSTIPEDSISDSHDFDFGDNGSSLDRCQPSFSKESTTSRRPLVALLLVDEHSNEYQQRPPPSCSTSASLQPVPPLGFLIVCRRPAAADSRRSRASEASSRAGPSLLARHQHLSSIQPTANAPTTRAATTSTIRTASACPSSQSSCATLLLSDYSVCPFSCITVHDLLSLSL